MSLHALDSSTHFPADKKEYTDRHQSGLVKSYFEKREKTIFIAKIEKSEARNEFCSREIDIFLQCFNEIPI